MNVLRAIRAFPPHGWLMFGLQMLLLFAANAVYEVTPGAAGGPADVALAHAHDIIRAERALRIFVELDIQRWAMDGPVVVVDVARWTYQNCQRLITWSFVIWLYLRRNAFFPRVRNTIITLDVLGLAGYFLYPTAPPRLTPGFGFVDILDPTQANLRSSLVGSLTNLYAAVPEPALRLRAAARHHRLPGLPAPGDAPDLGALPVLVVFATVATGNHWLLDAAAGVGRARDRVDDRQPAARRSKPASCAARPRRDICSRAAGLSPGTASFPASWRATSARMARRTPSVSPGASDVAGPGGGDLSRRGSVRRHQREHGPAGREVLPRLGRHDGLRAGALLHEQQQHVRVALGLQHRVVRLRRLDLDDLGEAEPGQRRPLGVGKRADEPGPHAIAELRSLPQSRGERGEEHTRTTVAEEVAREQERQTPVGWRSRAAIAFTSAPFGITSTGTPGARPLTSSAIASLTHAAPAMRGARAGRDASQRPAWRTHRAAVERHVGVREPRIAPVGHPRQSRAPREDAARHRDAVRRAGRSSASNLPVRSRRVASGSRSTSHGTSTSGSSRRCGASLARTRARSTGPVAAASRSAGRTRLAGPRKRTRSLAARRGSGPARRGSSASQRASTGRSPRTRCRARQVLAEPAGVRSTPRPRSAEVEGDVQDGISRVRARSLAKRARAPRRRRRWRQPVAARTTRLGPTPPSRW